MKTKYNRPIEGRERRSTRIADGQRDSTLTVGQLVKAIRRWSDSRSVDGGKKRRYSKEIRQKESMVEAGQSTIDNRSRVDS